ncbi:hypothetical protein A0P77_04330 [Salmonella enterica]|uniref:Uncharacterized protein n=2 Tax=Salmonella enterica I TaxID=59201 RepID=A0A5I8I033_SALET|nr:hypothetical protein [Salmonella enterica]EAB9081365.1 hypothetical protein [Salmonella enterica subsp. enterica]EAW2066653.1 hypothetical protein [Salmonella enterica subsp. diarizonae]EBU9774890.1 hypothetical protein [Salmonella enterica subsp. enterica serovar Kumasi]EBW8618229.1 hypothetical protein [Salmonella enterica subsp. enterica serovar Enteritidis]ECA4033043.1 hypothetical protein [Salmonella enterica subsp. enterica serovar Odozi]EDO2236280.1 hypothetical protein [Salmonella 
MAAKSEFFSSFVDIEKRPRFSSECEISPENFKALIGEYRLDEDVICQVKGHKGICHQKHRSGWLGVTSNGLEVLIGGHCARNYFKADKTFALERKRVRKEIDRKIALYKLDEYRKNKMSINDELSRLRQEIIDTRVKLDQVHKHFPNAVLSFIESAQKTKNWELKIDVQDGFADDGEAKWVSGSLGKRKTLPYSYEVFGLMNNVKTLSATFDEACQINPDDIKTPKLKRIIEILNEKEELKKTSSALHRDVFAFVEPRNLEPLIYTCDDHEEEFLAAKAIMAITGAKVSSEGHINLRLRRIKERIEKQFGGKLVRKNQISERFQRRNAFVG